LTRWLLFMTRETVWCETPAKAATSRMVTRDLANFDTQPFC